MMIGRRPVSNPHIISAHRITSIRNSLLVLLVLLAVFSTSCMAIIEVETIAQGDLERATQTTPLVEWFHAAGHDQLVEMLEEHDEHGEINLLHWRTNSSTDAPGWPESDAKARLTSFGLTSPALVIDNEPYEGELTTQKVELAIQQAREIRSTSLQTSQELIRSTATCRVVEMDGSRWLEIDIDITPQENLSKQTIAGVFLSEDNAIHDWQFNNKNLVREWSPEIGFSLEKGNTTTTTWNISAQHLEAAGIDLIDKKQGWTIQVVFFSAPLSQNEVAPTLVISTQVPTQKDEFDGSTILLFSVILSAIIARLAVATNGLRERELSMPEIIAYWDGDTSQKVILQFKTNSFGLQLRELIVHLPWKAKGKVKRFKMEAEQSKTITLQLTECDEQADLQISLDLDLGEGGLWMQNISLGQIQ